MESRTSYKNLSNLIKLNQDAKLIYTDAVQVTSNRALRKYLINRTREWDNYADQLVEHVQDPAAKSPTLAGNLKSTWFTLQGQVLGARESKILNTLIQQENVMLSECGKVSDDKTLPAEVQRILTNQAASITAARRNLTKWRKVE